MNRLNETGQGDCSLSAASLSTAALKPSTSSTPKPSRLALGRTGLPNRTHRRVLGFRATLERLVQEAHGGIVDALAAKRITTATLAYTEAVRAQKRLADAEDGRITLTEAELQGWSDRVGRNHDRADKIIASLGIDAKDHDPWAAIYSRQLPLPAPAPIPTPAKNAPPRTKSRQPQP